MNRQALIEALARARYERRMRDGWEQASPGWKTIEKEVAACEVPVIVDFVAEWLVGVEGGIYLGPLGFAKKWREEMQL